MFDFCGYFTAPTYPTRLYFAHILKIEKIAASPDEKRLCSTTAAAVAHSVCGGARDLLSSYSALNCLSSLTLSISALHEKP